VRPQPTRDGRGTDGQIKLCTIAPSRQLQAVNIDRAMVSRYAELQSLFKPMMSVRLLVEGVDFPVAFLPVERLSLL